MGATVTSIADVEGLQLLRHVIIDNGGQYNDGGCGIRRDIAQITNKREGLWTTKPGAKSPLGKSRLSWWRVTSFKHAQVNQNEVEFSCAEELIEVPHDGLPACIYMLLRNEMLAYISANGRIPDAPLGGCPMTVHPKLKCDNLRPILLAEERLIG